MERREFLKTLAVTAGAVAGAGGLSPEVLAEKSPAASAAGDTAHASCLVDTTLCIGCRRCEESCNRRNGLPRPERRFSDATVLLNRRRPTPDAYTVVNRYPGSPSRDQRERDATYVKQQCMHCLDPACVSACLVGALSKNTDGPVVYKSSICMGCRYCMVACPFGVPAYEYDDPITPRVRKCQFCANTSDGGGADPACAASCPTEAIVFGRRSETLHLARQRIDSRPGRYLPVIYGESEVGGTGWLYLVGREYKEIGLLDLPGAAAPRRTEAIQHGIFRYAAIPAVVYGGLAAMMWYNHRRNQLLKPEPDTKQRSDEREAE